MVIVPHWEYWWYEFTYTLTHRVWHFMDDIWLHLLHQTNISMLFDTSLTAVCMHPIANIWTLVQAQVWCRTGNNPLPDPMLTTIYPDNKVHGANIRPTWVLSAPDGPHIGPMNLAIRVWPHMASLRHSELKRCLPIHQDINAHDGTIWHHTCWEIQNQLMAYCALVLILTCDFHCSSTVTHHWNVLINTLSLS